MKALAKSAYAIVFIVTLLLFSPYHALMKDKLFADDASYLAHGFTLGLDHNLQYKDSVAEWKTANQKSAAHPIGPGLLAAPFIAGFSLIDKLNNDIVIKDHNQFQFSWSFFGFTFASIFFFVAGLYCYKKAIEILGFKLSAKHFIFIASSFGILFYVLFRPVMGHSFEFFSIALCFWSSCKIYQAMTEENYLSIKYLLICALGVVLTLQIRPADLNVILLPFILLGFQFLTRERTLAETEVKLILKTTPLYLLSLLICFLPFIYINEQLYGMVYPTSSAMYGPSTNPVPGITQFSDFLQTLLVLLSRLPQLWTILFSSEFGLAFSSAIILFGCCFIFYYVIANLKRKPSLAIFTLIMIGGYIALPITITLFWQSLGDAYGYRFLYCLFPLALLGYGYWHKQCIEKCHSFALFPFSLKWLQMGILILCGYGLLSNAFFGANSDLMYKPGVANSFGRPGGSAVGYNIEVLKAAPKMGTWMTLAATRVPGFFLVGTLALFDIDLRTHHLPDVLSEKMEKFYCCYEYPPLRVYLQALIALVMFIGGLGWLLRDETRER